MIRCAACKHPVPEMTACRFVNEHRRPERTVWLCRKCNPRRYGGHGNGKPGADDWRAPVDVRDLVRVLVGLVA